MLALLLLVHLARVFGDDCTSVGISSPYIDPNSGACYVANCTYIGTAPRLSFSSDCTGCVSDGGNWLALDQEGIPFSWDNGVTCRRAICNSTTMPNIGVILVDSSLCQNQVYCDPPQTGDSTKHPAGTSWPVATLDGCFQYYCTASGVVQPSAVSTHCCISSAFTGSNQYFSPGALIPAHSNGTVCITQQCKYSGATAGSAWVDTVVDQSLCSTSAPPANCNETVNGVTSYYDNGEVFGDFVQVRKISGDGFECKRKKCVNGVIIAWPTLNDPNCPPVARQTQTTTATVIVNGPAGSAPDAAADDVKDKVTGDYNDPGRVTVVASTPISSPTAVTKCKYTDGSLKPEGFQYRVQSSDADQHCVDRICKGGVFLGGPSPAGATCTSTPDTTPFNNPLSQGFSLQGTTQSFVCTLALSFQEDVDRLLNLFSDPTSVLRTGTFSAQSVDTTVNTLTYTCANGQIQTDSSQCTQDNAASELSPSMSIVFLLGLLVFV